MQIQFWYQHLEMCTVWYGIAGLTINYTMYNVCKFHNEYRKFLR